MLQMLRTLAGRPQPVATADALGRFAGSRAAFVSQKCTIEYCRARSGLNWDKLLLEAAFLEALERCRWEAFAAVLADLALVIEGLLRPAAAGREAAVADGLVALARRELAAHPEPAGLDGGWEGVAVALCARLVEAQARPPRSAAEIARRSGAVLHRLMPLHPTLMRLDEELVVNSVRFQMVRVAEDLRRVLKADVLVRDLAGAPAGGPG